MSDRLLSAIRESTPEEQLLALAELVRAVFRARGGGPVVIQDEDRRTIGYVLPPPGPSEFRFPQLSDDGAGFLGSGPGGATLSTAELLAELDRELAAQT